MSKNVWGAGLVAGAMALTLAGCGGASGGSGEDANELRVAFTVPAPPMDPHTAPTDIGLYPYASLVYDRLTEWGPEFEIRPLAAESWSTSEDGLVTTFKIREGLKFSDGEALDAAAVKASLDRALNHPESTAKTKLSMIDAVEVVDDLTVEVRLNRPAADLPAALGGLAGALVSPKSIESDDLDVKPVGSGPYVATEVKLGDSITFERVEDYWDDTAGLVDRIEVVGMADDNARLNALRSGQVDMVTAKLSMVDNAAKIDGVEVYEHPAAQMYDIFLNTDSKPLDDVRVRQALNYAIDRDQLNTSLLSGRCQPAVQPLGEVMDGHLNDVPVSYDYDVARAKELLAEAGYADGFSMKMLVIAGLAPQIQLAPAVQAMLKDVGVDVTIDEVDANQAASVYGEGAHDAYVHAKQAHPTSAQTLASAYLQKPFFVGKPDAKMSELVDTALDSSTSAGERTAALEEASERANEEALDVFLCALPTIHAFRDGVTGVADMGVSYFQGTFDLRRVSVED